MSYIKQQKGYFYTVHIGDEESITAALIGT